MPETTSGISALLRLAAAGDREASGRLLENFRSCLHRLADRQLHGGLAARLDNSDIVQQTFLEAHRALAQFLFSVRRS